MKDDAPRSANLSPGFDESNTYEGKDLSEFPNWWQKNIEQFSKYGLRPYRPPRFEDGGLIPEVIRLLQKELGTSIELRAINPSVNDDWSIWVDGEYVMDIARERTREGFTLYHMNSRQFKRIIREAGSD